MPSVSLTAPGRAEKSSTPVDPPAPSQKAESGHFGKEFTDDSFPPNAKSLGPWNGMTTAEIEAQIEW